MAPRGIPQGNGVSSFLGNIYLLPLDFELVKVAKQRNLKYLRYMDDVKVLAKDSLLQEKLCSRMNEKLRSLRLNIQGAKTRILQDADVQGELNDSRLQDLNELIKRIQPKSGSISASERNGYSVSLKKILGKMKVRNTIIKGKDLRLFRRLVTAFSIVHHSGMVGPLLDQLERNPDAQLLDKAVRYLRLRDRNFKTIAERVSKLLRLEREHFPYQQARLLTILQYVRSCPPEALKLAKHLVTRKKVHWYVRQQAAILLGSQQLPERTLTRFVGFMKVKTILRLNVLGYRHLGKCQPKSLKRL